jgi:hypothetical protein
MSQTTKKTCEFCGANIVKVKEHQKSQRCKKYQNTDNKLSDNSTSIEYFQPDGTSTQQHTNFPATQDNTFKTLTDLPNYQVNSKGEVYNQRTGNLLKAQKHPKTGAYSVNLYKKGQDNCEKKTLRKLVYEYHGQFPNLVKFCGVGHNDNDQENLDVTNLAPKAFIPTLKLRYSLALLYNQDTEKFHLYLRTKDNKETIATFEVTDDIPTIFSNFFNNRKIIENKLIELHNAEDDLEGNILQHNIIEEIKSYINKQ